MAAEGESYEVRLMRRNEIPQALEIWKETGMHEGTHCLDTWFEVDPEGFHVAVTSSGEVLGVCAGVFNHEDLAFVGLYAVREKCRGRGIGPKIWKAVLNHIGDRNAGVNAVPGKLEVYRDRGGFPLQVTQWKPVSYERHQHINADVLLEHVAGVQVQPMSGEILPYVIEYDSKIHNYRREKIITLTVGEGDSVSLVALEEGKGKVCGYGVLKLSIQGHGQVGPLYADSQKIAEVLLRNLIHSLPQARGLALMIVDSNPGANAIVEKLGLQVEEDGTRCYRKCAVDADRSKIFGQLDLNFAPF